MSLLAAVQFLTRLPIRLRTAPDLQKAIPWFPVVGALIGVLVGATATGLFELVPPLVTASIAVLVGVMVTGAFHEDGLADTADAMGGTTPERRREILKDSRHGSYGVAAMCGSMLLRVACVASLGPATAFASLIAAHTLGRGAAVSVMGLAPATRQNGLGAEYMRALPLRRSIVGVAAALLLAGVAVGWWIAPMSIAVALGAALVTWIALRAFEGVSGDILGAIEQVGECLVLIVATGLAVRHPLWWT